MELRYGAREIARNPSLLRIDPKESFIVEDKKAHKQLGIYLGIDLAQEFLAYRQKQKLLQCAHKIKASAIEENNLLDESISDGL